MKFANNKRGWNLKLLATWMSLSLLSPLALAQEDWINIAASDESKWHVKSGSLESTKTRGGTPIAVVIGRISNETTKRIDLFKWYVPIQDCERGLGKVVSLGIDGEYKFENDFVNGSGSIATAMAEAICGAQKYRTTERQKKGI
ncbi:hypothetical protein [Rhizobacter fulvus]